MKKLLSLLSILTISGSAMPTIIAASPYKEEEIKLENNGIIYSQTNNLENLKRDKRQYENSNLNNFNYNDVFLTPLRNTWRYFAVSIRNAAANIIGNIRMSDNAALAASTLSAAIIGAIAAAPDYENMGRNALNNALTTIAGIVIVRLTAGNATNLTQRIREANVNQNGVSIGVQVDGEFNSVEIRRNPNNVTIVEIGDINDIPSNQWLSSIEAREV
ncbi:hypothetical protein [Spiroplasma endosymbiont of Polydrusus pterygomalis]|uniref:hypothetical protein n=1 Tax=Spiroplasma endosymbiont of Polydrusus pterygomalis TaxID=3139327 RepID=UPI003CCAE9A5